MSLTTPRTDAETDAELLEKSDGRVTAEMLAALPEALRAFLATPEVVRIIAHPERETSRELAFSLGTRDLVPGETIVVLTGPLEGFVRDVVLGHRKREAFWNLQPGQDRKGNDPDGAYSSVEVFDATTNRFVGWKDPKGYNPVKYAERRSDVEFENLHDWPSTVGRVAPLAVAITSAGEHRERSIVTEVSLEIVTVPAGDRLTYDTHVFTPGTVFSEYAEAPATLPTYGGGKHEGGYPDAVALGGKNGKEHFRMTESLDAPGMRLDELGRLHVALTPGKTLQCVEVAIGDTWFNYKGPGKLQLGWAKLDVALRHADGREDPCIVNANIPPQGVLAGGPPDATAPLVEGDELLIRSQNTSYLMGVRITYGAPDATVEVADVMATPIPEPLNLAALKLVPTGKKAGTQGGGWFVDEPTGKKFFVKEYHGNRDRCATEYIVNSIYAALDVASIRTYLHEDRAITEELQDIEMFTGDKYNKEQVRAYFDHPDLRAGFVADAWLANWDVFGLDYDNIVRTKDGRMPRMDAGGSLFYRAMGAPKPSFANADVSEVQTMRNPAMAREAGTVFSDISDEEIRGQVARLQERMTDARITDIVEASGISNAKEVIGALVRRRDWLVKTYL